MMKRQAKVTLRQEAIDRLVGGKTVTIRLEDIELEIRFDSLARIGKPSRIEEMFADVLGRRAL
jgi:hypothetical protein